MKRRKQMLVVGLVLFLSIPLFSSEVSVASNVKNALNRTAISHISDTNATDSDSVSTLLSHVADNNTSKVPLIEEAAMQSEEKKDSLAIFFILIVIVAATLLVHCLIVTEVHYMPESLAIVLLGSFIGLILSYSKWDWRDVETLNPNVFFLVLLPPIIFESGYTLNKGHFFSNIVPVLTFAVLGTAISAFVIGFSLYILGQADLIYRLSYLESFAFGALISAVDPVPILTVFRALKVDVQLYMLVFGESMLNDAVSIVLTSTTLEIADPKMAQLDSWDLFKFGISRFLVMFIGSAILGSAVGFISALLFKHVDFRKTPSLELALLLVFAYIPYGLAEAISLSGIMAILFCAIIMSQYTHFNISTITQLTMQQTFRTISFVAETCTFAYLGLALFTIHLVFHPAFFIWSIILLFIGRAFNIFPLSFVVNKCQKSQISLKTQLIIWFSGMRGAVAFALALHIRVENEETRLAILTNTLFLVLFTIIFLGGSTLPMIKILSDVFPEETTTKSHKRRRSRRHRSEKVRKRKRSPVILSKTQEMALLEHSEHFTEHEESDRPRRKNPNETKNIFIRLNEVIVKPLFVRKFTHAEKLENKQKFTHLATEALKNTGDLDSSSEELFLNLNNASKPIDSQPLLPTT